MVLETDSLKLLPDALKKLEQGFSAIPDFETEVDLDAMQSVLEMVAERMQDNYPYAHPLYAGQMLKPPHPMARLAYMLALWVNPNNHALDGGRASSAMEKEAVAAIAEMFGWQQSLGHLTSGGTMANLEALWIAGQLHPDKMIVGSAQAHYTHARITEVLKLEYQSVSVNQYAQMDIDVLESLLKTGRVGTVVVTLGTTGVGSVDPLKAILELKQTYDFRIHIDAAYGGYFRLVDSLDDNALNAFAMINEADSIVVDPHKCGLQPYGCGCVLFKDPSVGRLYQHDSPYTYFSSDELHLGEISLECSRAGAGAVALWATQQLLPMTREGEFAHSLTKSRAAALELFERFNASSHSRTLMRPELDILIWIPEGRKSSEISEHSEQLFDACAEEELHLAVIKLPVKLARAHWPDVDYDTETITCMRSCLMKPEHIDWLDEIIRRYEIAYNKTVK